MDTRQLTYAQWYEHASLLFIEVGFHITMLICAVAMALGFVRLTSRKGNGMDSSEQEPV